LGYVILRTLESIMLILAAICPLLLITLSQEYITVVSPDIFNFNPAATLLITLRSEWSLLILAFFYCLSALLFYYVLYKTKLVPRFISVWGLIGAVMAFTTPFLGTLLGVPMGLNEIFLGVWLIVKGFKNYNVVYH